MAQGRDRIVKYARIEDSKAPAEGEERKVGYRLFNADNKSIGYIRENEFKNIKKMADNKSMAVLYLSKKSGDDSPNVEKEIAEFIIENKDDTLVLEDFPNYKDVIG